VEVIDPASTRELKTEALLNNVSSYLTGNTLPLCYADQQISAVKVKKLLFIVRTTRNAFCRQSVEYVKAGGAYSNHWAVKG
jgi:hypothetical protein